MQETPAQRVAVVGNGAPLPLPPDGVTGVESPENLIVAGGRNAALARLAESGDIDGVVDLDDDGLPISPEAFTRLAGLYDRDERLGVVSFRICDERVSPSGEEIDLAWRALDAGWKVLYEPPTLVLQASVTSPTRHAVFHRMVARNRVWPAGQAPSARPAGSRLLWAPGPFSPRPGSARGAGSAPGSRGSPKACARRARHGGRCGGGPPSGARPRLGRPRCSGCRRPARCGASPAPRRVSCPATARSGPPRRRRRRRVSTPALPPTGAVRRSRPVGHRAALASPVPVRRGSVR